MEVLRQKLQQLETVNFGKIEPILHFLNFLEVENYFCGIS